MAGTWSNAGVLQVSAGTLQLGGTISTSAIGQIQRSGSGFVSLVADLNNASATLDASSGGAGWWLGAGTIAGGTLISTAPGSVWASGTYLKNLSLAADLAVQGTATFDNVALAGGTVRLVGTTPVLQLLNGDVLAGAGTITMKARTLA